RASVGSATPRASTRCRRICNARSVDCAFASTRLVSWVSRMLLVPPFRSSPSRGELDQSRKPHNASTPRVIRARNRGLRDGDLPEELLEDLLEDLPWENDDIGMAPGGRGRRSGAVHGRRRAMPGVACAGSTQGEPGRYRYRLWSRARRLVR